MKGVSRDIDASRLKLAQIKYFDKAHNGLEVTSMDAYAFLYEINGNYVNPFNVFEELPVYKRVPYANTTRDGEDFGSKIVHVQGDIKNGPCYVIGFTAVEDLFRNEDLDIEVLKDFIVNSRRFFIDRPEIMKSFGVKDKFRYREKIESDEEMLRQFTEYMDSHSMGYQYQK